MGNNTTLIIPTCGTNFSTALQPCLESLVLNTEKLKVGEQNSVRLLIIANGVKDKKQFDDFITQYEERYNIVTHWHEEAMGYVGAINDGLKRVLAEDDADYVLFMNDDVQVYSPDWLTLLKSPFDNDPAMGLVGAKEIQCPVTGVWFPLGWCVLIKKEVFKKIGLLDSYWGVGYADDTDYFIKATQEGYHTHCFIHDTTGSFPISHQAENTMHSGEIFSRKVWDDHTARNRKLLADRYWQTIHVIVPVYKRYHKLSVALDSIRRQYYDKVKIHVVADGHDAAIQKIVEEKKKEWIWRGDIEYTFVPYEGGYGGIPRKSVLDGLPNNENEFVVFVDSDNVIEPDYLLKMWQSMFLKPDVGMAVCKINHIEMGGIIPEPEYWKKIEWSHIDSLNVMVRLSLAKKHADKWIHDKNRTQF